jgi:aryl-alcohol dehydrogenase-like predicted oxidoreductase
MQIDSPTRRADLEPEDWRLQNPRFTDEAITANSRLADLVGEIARELDATAAQVALAWVLSRNPSIAAIPGTRKIERLEENWTSQELALRTEHLQRLESMVALGVGAIGTDQYRCDTWTRSSVLLH